MFIKFKSFIIFGIALAVPILFLACEWVFGTPVADSSIFRYIGCCVADGGTMYVDAWDNKGPILLGTAALGQWLFPFSNGVGSTVMFALAAMAAITFFYRISQSAWMTLVFTLLYQGNNAGLGLVSQETLAMPFMLAAVAANLNLNDKNLWRGVVLGVCVAMVIFIKANLIGFSFAVLVLAWSRLRNLRMVVIWVGWSVVGFLLTVSVICGVFAMRGTFCEMIDATFLFGMFEYGNRSVSWYKWWSRYWHEWSLGSGGWIMVHFAAMLLLAIMARVRQGWLWTWLVIDLVFTFCFKTFYRHYLIVLYPQLCLILLWSRQWQWAVRMLLIATMLVFAGYSVYGIRGEAQRQCELNTVVERVRGMKIATWGDLKTAEVLVRAGIKSPQRYFEAYMNHSFAGDKRKREICTELEDIVARGEIDAILLETKHLDDFRLASPMFDKLFTFANVEKVSNMLLFNVKK